MSRARAAAVLGAAGLAAATLWLALATSEYNVRLERERPSAVFDFFSYYRPNAEYAFGRMRRGDLPLWSPQQGIGGPFLATLQTGVLYPPNAVHCILPAQSAFAVLAFAHLMLAGVFAGWLARCLGARPLGSLSAGLLYALSYQLWNSVWTPPTLYAAAWMPAVLAAVVRAADDPGPRRAAVLAAALGMQLLVGWPYTVAMTAFAATFTGGAAVLAAARRRRGIPLAALATLALGVAGGAALAAPQILPALELMQRSTRASGALEERTGHSSGELHDPAAYLRSMIGSAGGGAVPGLASPLLAAIAVAVGGARRWQAAVLLAVGLVSLAISFADWTPLYGWIRRLPLLGDFRFPFRYRLVTTLALATCAGIGVSRFEQRGTRRATGIGVVVAALAVAALVLPLGRAFGGAVAFPRNEAEPTTALLAELAGSDAFAAQRALVRAPANAGWRSYWRVGGVEKLGQREGILTLQDLEPLSLATLARMMEFFSGDAAMERPGDSGSHRGIAPPYSGSARLPHDAARAGVLDLLSVRFLVLVQPPDWLASRWSRVEEIEHPPLVFRNEGALPRAWRASRLELEPEDPLRALARLVAPDFDLRRTALLDRLPPGIESEAAVDADAHSEIELDEAERLVIRTEGREPAVLVLNDAWYPGWRATLDGRAASILRANTAFRAVAVPAGAHRVEMRYEPRTFQVGLGVAAVAMLGLLASCLVGA
jgi:hypothetical protein